jgi:hypothetical protein
LFFVSLILTDARARSVCACLLSYAAEKKKEKKRIKKERMNKEIIKEIIKENNERNSQ